MRDASRRLAAAALLAAAAVCAQAQAAPGDPTTTTTVDATTTTTSAPAPVTNPFARTGSTTCPAIGKTGAAKGLDDRIAPAVFLGAVPKHWQAGKPLTIRSRACDNFPYVGFEVRVFPATAIPVAGRSVVSSEFVNVGGIFRGTWKWAGSAVWTWRKPKPGSYEVCASALDTHLSVAQMCKPIVVR